MRLKHLALLFTVMLIAAPAAMADEFVYAPDNCEFQITFPSEPHKAQRCDSEDPTNCHEVTNFTNVFGLDATVDIRVTCNKAEDKMYERYSGDVMKTTLEAIVGKNKLGDFESHYQETEHAKQAVLIGSGLSGNSNKIYMAQLWIGKTSVFTLEAELIGGPLEEADAMFAEILRSATLKEVKAEAAEEVESSDDADKENKEEDDKKADANKDAPAK